jgi:plasmid replication initiation protein
MVRKNEKEALMNYENSIKKSNELSMAKLNHGLSLNQMQLLAFAIFSTQKNGVTKFHKAEFEKKFNIEYKTQHAKQDAQKVMSVMFSVEDLQNDYFEYWNVFRKMRYEKGVFSFVWDEEMLPHILELKEKYITTDLSVTSQFKSGFSWTLYDYLKAHFGYWHKSISKEALMRLFGVENKKTYKNSAQFKRGVLDVAIKEINEFTELEVWYKEIKKGRAIVGFDIHWSNGSTLASATEKQIKELKTIVDSIFDDMFKYINLNDAKNRLRAIELVKEIENHREFTTEPISITKEYANTLIKQSNAHLRELERMLEYDKIAPNVAFYNWLDERE